MFWCPKCFNWSSIKSPAEVSIQDNQDLFIKNLRAIHRVIMYTRKALTNRSELIFISKCCFPCPLIIFFGLTNWHHYKVSKTYWLLSDYTISSSSCQAVLLFLDSSQGHPDLFWIMPDGLHRTPRLAWIILDNFTWYNTWYLRPSTQLCSGPSPDMSLQSLLII